MDLISKSFSDCCLFCCAMVHKFQWVALFLGAASIDWMAPIQCTRGFHQSFQANVIFDIKTNSSTIFLYLKIKKKGKGF